MEQLLQVGVISSTHGVRGEVKAFPTTDDVRRFKKLKNVLRAHNSPIFNKSTTDKNTRIVDFIFLFPCSSLGSFEGI